MKISNTVVSLFAIVLFFSCSSKLPGSYHMEKKYWEVSDYDEAIRYIKFNLSKDEGYPRLDDPFTAPVFNKLVDKQNVSVVLEDNALGLKHRSETGEEFFRIAGELLDLYRALDKQDKFTYPLELSKIFGFAANAQLLYFKTGNEAMVKDAVNTNDEELQRVLQSNEQRIVDNFNIYLELIAKEDAFTESAIKSNAEVINYYYPRLVTDFPNANYSTIKNNATALSDKVKSPELKKVLTNFTSLIK